MRALSQQGHGPGDKDVAGYKTKRSYESSSFLFCNTALLNLYGKPCRTVQITSVQEIANNPVYFPYTIVRQYSQTGRKVCRYTRLFPGDKSVMPVTIKNEIRL